MRIGELATRSGVSVRALRYYEEQGLLASERSASGQRRYAGSAEARVRLIQQLYAAGLSSRTIVEFLPCIHARVSTPETRIDGLRETRDRLDAVIADAAAAV